MLSFLIELIMEKGFIFIAACLLVAGIIVFLANFFSKKAMVKRHLRKAVLKRIESVSEGETVKISGRVELTGEALIAPLSGRKCAYYHVLVEQCVNTGKSSHYVKLIEEEVAGKFGIRDGRSCARVVSRDSGVVSGEIESYIVDDRKYSSGIFNDPSEVLENYLNSHGKKSDDFMGFNKSIRYKEGILEEGEVISVLGKASWKHAEAGEWSDDFGKLLIIGPTDKMPVYLSDATWHVERVTCHVSREQVT